MHFEKLKCTPNFLDIYTCNQKGCVNAKNQPRLAIRKSVGSLTDKQNSSQRRGSSSKVFLQLSLCLLSRISGQDRDSNAGWIVCMLALMMRCFYVFKNSPLPTVWKCKNFPVTFSINSYIGNFRDPQDFSCNLPKLISWMMQNS